MTIHFPSLFASLFRMNGAFSGVGQVLQRLAQFPDTRPDRGHRGMNG